MNEHNELKPARQRNWGDAPMNDKQDGGEWRRRRLRVTGELVGGLIAGLGAGMAMAIEHAWPYPVNILLIFVGGSIAYYYQLKRDDEQRNPRK